MTSLFTVQALPVWEGIEICGTIIVGLGVLGEYLAEFTKFSKTQQQKESLGKFSTLVLIGGIAIEILGLSMALHYGHIEKTVLEKQIEELRKSNLELQVKIQPRKVTNEQRERFVEGLKDQPKTATIHVHFNPGSADSETKQYTEQLQHLFLEAGYKVDPQIVGTYLFGTPYGVHIEVNSDNTAPGFAMRIWETLNVVGIETRLVPGAATEDSVNIIVGNKNL